MGVGGSNREVAPEKDGGERLGFGRIRGGSATVLEFHRAGFAAVSIEDQVFPKRCAFAKGVRVVDRPDALARVRAALE